MRYLIGKDKLTEKENVIFEILHLIVTAKPGGSNMWNNMRKIHMQDPNLFIDRLVKMPQGTKYSINAVGELLAKNNWTAKSRSGKDSTCVIPFANYATAWH